jgi:hypothetical protein
MNIAFRWGGVGPCFKFPNQSMFDSAEFVNVFM